MRFARKQKNSRTRPRGIPRVTRTQLPRSGAAQLLYIIDLHQPTPVSCGTAVSRPRTAATALDAGKGRSMILEGLDQLCLGHRRAALDADLPGPAGAGPAWSSRRRSRSCRPCGPPDDGGRDEVDESLRACRSSSSTRAESRPTCPLSSEISRYASASCIVRDRDCLR